jgi:hypothetical protein
MARNEGAVNRVLRVIVGPSDALARIHRPAEAVGVARSRAVDHRICWVLFGLFSVWHPHLSLAKG